MAEQIEIKCNKCGNMVKTGKKNEGRTDITCQDCYVPKEK